MARDFASTDNVSVGSILLPSTFSCCAWVRKSTDTGSFPRLFDNKWVVCGFDDSGATAAWRFERGDWSGGRGIWEWTCSLGATFATCAHAAWTYDGTNVANDPVFYQNLSQLSLSSDTNGIGTLTLSDTQPCYIGNRNTDFLRPWGGSIGYVSIYNVVLTFAEIQEAYTWGYTNRGLLGYWKLEGQSPEPDYSGLRADATVTGTTVTANCPVSPLKIRSPQLDFDYSR